MIPAFVLLLSSGTVATPRISLQTMKEERPMCGKALNAVFNGTRLPPAPSGRASVLREVPSKNGVD